MDNIENTLENKLEMPNIIKLNSIDSSKIINPNVEEQHNIIEESDSIQIQDEQKIDTTTDPNIVYMLLLNNIHETISGNNDLFGTKNVNIKKPDIKYMNRKTFWFNYDKNCSQINRSVQQLQKYYEKELAVDTSINEKLNLLFKGRFSYDIVASMYKKYIKNYVQCSTCKSLNTEIVRNSSNRLDYLKCLNNKCNTCKVVTKI